MATKTIYKGFVFNIYPNKKQEKQINLMIRNSRFVWNQMLEMHNERYKNNKNLKTLKFFDYVLLLKPLKNQYPLLKKSDTTSLRHVCKNLYQSWQNFFNKNMPDADKPKFHSRFMPNQSYTGDNTINKKYPNSNTVKLIKKHYIKLPKLGIVKISKNRKMKNYLIKSYTIKKTSTNKYTLTLTVKINNQRNRKKTNQNIGIDVNIRNFLTGSNGIKFKTFKRSIEYQKAKQWQSKYSRRRHLAKTKVAFDKHKKVLQPRELNDFTNWQHARILKARFQRKIANARKYYLGKITSQLVKNYDLIVIEDLNIKKMQKNHYLAEAIANASWYEFRTMLQYKCDYYGKKLVIVNPKNTSRICHNCGSNNGPQNLPINKHLWTCKNCHKTNDVDINAAKNILDLGIQKLKQEKKESNHAK